MNFASPAVVEAAVIFVVVVFRKLLAQFYLQLMLAVNKLTNALFVPRLQMTTKSTNKRENLFASYLLCC